MSKDGVREFRELLDSTKFQADILEDLNKISKTTFIKPEKKMDIRFWSDMCH